MTERRRSEIANHQEILDQLKEIKTTLAPIASAYDAAVKLGTWAKWGLGFILLLTSLFLAFREIFKQP